MNIHVRHVFLSRRRNDMVVGGIGICIGLYDQLANDDWACPTSCVDGYVQALSDAGAYVYIQVKLGSLAEKTWLWQYPTYAAYRQ